MFSNQDFTPTAASFSKLLTHAVLDLFKGVQIVRDWVDGPLFCAEYLLGERTDKIDVDSLENRWIELQNKSIDFSVMEMVPVSARGLFASVHQRYLQQEVEEAEGILPIIRIGPYVDLQRYEIDPYYAKGCAKFISAELTQEGKQTFLTVKGVVAKDKQTLKEHIKREKFLEKNRHDRQVPPILMDDEVLLPKGTQLLEQLQSQLEKTFFEFGFDKVTLLSFFEDSPFKVLKKLALKQFNSKFYTFSKEVHDSNNPLQYGLFQLKNTTTLNFVSRPDKESLQKECISCLKFYDQIIKILGFSYLLKYQRGSCGYISEVVSAAVERLNIQKEELTGKKTWVQLDVIDKLNRVVFSPTLTFEQRGEEDYLIRGVLCASLEAILAHKMEQERELKPLVGHKANT